MAAQAVGDALNGHINVLVVQMNKRSSDKQVRREIKLKPCSAGTNWTRTALFSAQLSERTSTWLRWREHARAGLRAQVESAACCAGVSKHSPHLMQVWGRGGAGAGESEHRREEEVSVGG
eukprot:208609-Rhodomonas_salina.1